MHWNDREVEAELTALQRDALLANPLLESNRLLLVKRRPTPRRAGAAGLDVAMPSNHEGNSSLARTDYDNEICALSPISPRGQLRTIYRPPGGGSVGEVDLHWAADRLLFTQSDATNWKLCEMRTDGSAFFRVPANTPIALQPLDAEGKAVQLMRSWFTVMPGENASCIGCHEPPAETPRPQMALAARRPPRDLTPWHGPARGFDFEREVQPVLDRHCVRCHGGGSSRREQTQSEIRKSPSLPGPAAAMLPDLRSLKLVPNYAGRRISQMGIDRLHPKMRADTQGLLKYTQMKVAHRDAFFISGRQLGRNTWRQQQREQQ